MVQVLIKGAKFSYVYVFTKTKDGNDGSKGKYQVDILWPKADQQTTNEVSAALQQVYAQAQADPKFAEVMVRGTFKYDVIKDGARQKFGKKDYDLYKDCYYIVAKSNEMVGVIDASGRPLTTDREFFAGCTGNAGIAFKTYAPSERNPKSGFGINVALLALMKTGGTEADRLSGNASVDANQFFGVQGQAQMPGFPAPGMPQPAPQFQPQQPAQANAYQAQQPAATGFGSPAPNFGAPAPQGFTQPGQPAVGLQGAQAGYPAQQFAVPAQPNFTPQAPQAPAGNPFQPVAQPPQSPGMPTAPQFQQPAPQPGPHQPTPAWPSAPQAPAQGFDPFPQQAQQPAWHGQPQQ